MARSRLGVGDRERAVHRELLNEDKRAARASARGGAGRRATPRATSRPDPRSRVTRPSMMQFVAPRTHNHHLAQAHHSAPDSLAGQQGVEHGLDAVESDLARDGATESMPSTLTARRMKGSTVVASVVPPVRPLRATAPP